MKEKNNDKIIPNQKTHKMTASLGKYNCASPNYSSGIYTTANSTLIN